MEGLICIRIKGVSLTITFYHLNKATSLKSRFLALINNQHISSNSQVIHLLYFYLIAIEDTTRQSMNTCKIHTKSTK
jgi:hypothetical protein